MLTAYGRWRVAYPCGGKSIPMSLDCAREYASIFGGRVEPYPGRETLVTRVMWRLFLRRLYGREVPA